MNYSEQLQTWMIVIGGLFAGLVLISLYRRREAIAQRLRYMFMVIGATIVGGYIATKFTQDGVKVGLFALLVEVIAIAKFRPSSRSRYIPRSEKRKAIARFERSGKRYDPRKHHLDHVIPHSRGGSNRADNLRVKDSDENLAKSDRSPWWDVFGRR